ncbi:MAG TPA: tripartite tricarboxylate transporter substrate binding protein [Pseudolabrys sp.]|nr:tripartite tricarboxylate transporter substrate binding protein [Pseudolabrys sp.]
MKTLCAVRLAALAISTCAVLCGGQAVAQDYPNRPIHMIVAYSAGGTGDVVARILSDKLGAALGQSIIVENRAGASGNIGARTVATATPDGYMLLLGQTGEISINQHWMKDVGFDADKDLQPIALASVVPLALVVPANAPYSTMADYLAFLKSGKPSTYASAGTGTPGHFAGELLKLRTKANMTHVPYKGAGPALNDLVGAHVDMYFPGFPAVTPLMKAGSLKLLAVSSATRAPSAPDVPSVAEISGIKNFDFTLWQGIFAPHGTPDAVVKRLNAEINKILASDEIKKKFADLGAEIRIKSVAQFAAFTRAESEKYVSVIKETGAQPE